MKKIFIPLLLAMVVSVDGCGTAGRSYVETEMVETLEVEILPNTSKMFTYRLRWPEDHIPNHIRVDRGGGGDARRDFQRGGVDIGRGTYERLLENTAYVVEHSAYCRDGFFELDRNISRYHLWVRGECKDGATADDLKVFGTKQSLGPDRWRKAD